MIRTRFAPSPTGYMHIGNLRTALYGYLFARKNNGRFILRIEDTDQERFVEGSLDVIYKTLAETGLVYDEGPDKDGGVGPYVQSERRSIYKEYAELLVQKSAAYYCFCTDEQLTQARTEAEAKGETYKYDKRCLHLSAEEIASRLTAGESYVIRQNTPLEGSIGFTDAIFGEITVDCAELDDMVLLKSDGLPTYNFANVVDDHLMNITHVMRGSEYLSSTPKYNLLYRAFGWEPPVYVHLPLIMKDAHNKLSKRNGDASYQDLMEKGYLMEAVINYITLLGWSSGTNQEIFTREELIDAFSLEGISKSPAIFDPLKLRWMNAEYIKALPAEQFAALAAPWLDQSVAAGRYDYAKIAKILQQRVEIFSEIPEKIAFLPSVGEYDNLLYTHKKFKIELPGALAALQIALPALEALNDWSEHAIHETLIALAAEKGMKNGQLLWPVRVALTGQESTPGGAIELSDILGKDETLKRISAGIEKLQSSL